MKAFRSITHSLKRSFSRSGLSLITLSGIVAFSPASYGRVVIPDSCANGCTLPLPCKEAIEQKEENKLVWEPCQIVKYGHDEAEQAKDTQKQQDARYFAFSKDGILDSYNKEMQKTVDEMYKKSSDPTYCSLVPNEFVSSREVHNNNAGKSCGKYAEIQVKFEYEFTSIFGTTYATGFKSGPTTIYNNVPPLSSKETAWVKSGFILLLACEKGSVQGGLEGNTIRIGGGACRNSAEKYLASLKVLDKYGTNHRYDVDCRAYWDKKSNANLGEEYNKSKNALDQGEGKQTSQQICAIREYSKAMAGDLAACETISRTMEKYLKRIGNQAVLDAIYKDMDKGVSQVCVSECLAKWPPNKETAKNPPSEAEVSACANTCYQREADRVIEGILRDRAGKC